MRKETNWGNPQRSHTDTEWRVEGTISSRVRNKLLAACSPNLPPWTDAAIARWRLQPATPGSNHFVIICAHSRASERKPILTLTITRLCG